jgi:hypothetical protein
MVAPVRHLARLAAALAACTPPAGPGGSAGETTSSADTTAAAPTSGATTDACERSGDCDSEGICVADYAPSPDPKTVGTRGAAMCAAADACIAALDLTRWCFDHQGCCEALRCRADGVCEPPQLGQTTGDDADTSTGTTGDATTELTGTDTTDGSTGGDTGTT